LVQIDLRDEGGAFSPGPIGIAFSEAYGGCGIVIVASESLKVGDRCRVQVGGLSPLLAEVVWREEIDKQAMKIGLKFLE
jgi:hypothetical protein